MRALLTILGLAALVLGVFVYTRSDGGGPDLRGPELSTPGATVDAADGANLVQPDLASSEESPARTAAAVESPNAGERPGAAAATVARFRGRLVDGLGRAVSGAQVTLTRAPQRFSFGAPAETEVLAAAKSDARGTFDVPADELAAGAPARLRVQARGLARLDREVRVPAEPVAELGDVVLDFGVILGGRVIDADGNPVEGAELRVEEERGGRFVVVGMELGHPVATTDGSGRFEIVDQPVGPWTFQITHPEHPDLWVDGETTSADDHRADLQFTLRTGARIEGRIVGAAAAELEDVELLAWPANASSAWLSRDDLGSSRSMPRPRPAAVASDGRFVVGGLEIDAAYNLQGKRPVQNSFWDEAVTETELVAAGERGVEIAWSEGAAVELRVVDAKTGAPIERLGVRSGLGYLMRLTDELGTTREHFPEGLVRLDGVRPTPDNTTLDVELLAPGYEAWSRTEIELVVGETVDLGTIALVPMPQVQVTVLDSEDDRPVAGARVELRKEENADGSVRVGMRLGAPGGRSTSLPGEPSIHRDRTDRDGRAVVSSFPGASARLHVRAEGYAPLKSDVLELPDGDIQLTLRAVAGGTATITVLDRAGEPAAGHVVEHARPDGSSGTDFESAHEKRTDDDGRVEFEHLEPGRHHFRIAEDVDNSGLTIRLQGVGGTPPGEGWVGLDIAGGGAHALDLVLAPRSVLEGVVTERGVPLAGADLRLSREGAMPFLMGNSPTAKTSSTGAYRFDDVKAGEYELSIAHRTRALPTTIDVALDEGENERDVDLAINLVTGRITNLDDEPIAGASVRARRAKGSGQQTGFQMVMVTSTGGGASSITLSNGADDEGLVATTDEEGRYELRGLPIDTPLEVRVRADDHQPQVSEAFELAAGEDRDGVDVVLVAAGRVLVRADLSALPGMYMAAARFVGETEEPVEGKSATLSTQGECTLSEMAAGPWEISLRALGPQDESAPELPAPRTVDVVAGEELVVEF